MNVSRFSGSFALASALLACGGGQEPAKAPMADVGIGGTATPLPSEAPSYSYDSLDSRPVSSSAFLGKPTVLIFVTTFDMLSQAQVDYVIAMAKHDAESVNYAIVALQGSEDRELLEQYALALGVTVPVALGDKATMTGGGPLGDVSQVPSVVLFDRQGHIHWRKTGLAKSDELRTEMKGL